MRASWIGVWMAAACSCAPPAEDAASDEASWALQQDFVATQANARSQDLTHQRILTTMRVASATGPGCPTRPSWDQESVPEGNAFTLMFHQMELQVAPAQTPVTRELYCDVAIEIASPGPVSWSVTDFQYSGYASLKPGMLGTLGVRYDFAANQQLGTIPEFLRALPVPTDDSFFYDADPLRVVWSPCTTRNTLALRLRIVLSSTNRQEAGLITLSQVDGRLSQVRVDLASRSCTTSDGAIIRR